MAIAEGAEGRRTPSVPQAATAGIEIIAWGLEITLRSLPEANLLHSGRVTGLYSSKNHLARPVFLLSFSKALGSLR